jgi:hypothetical protein
VGIFSLGFRWKRFASPPATGLIPSGKEAFGLGGNFLAANRTGGAGGAFPKEKSGDLRLEVFLFSEQNPVQAAQIQELPPVGVVFGFGLNVSDIESVSSNGALFAAKRAQ